MGVFCTTVLAGHFRAIAASSYSETSISQMNVRAAFKGMVLEFFSMAELKMLGLSLKPLHL